MTPQEGLAHFAGLSPSNIKMGLERVQLALARLGNPERSFPALHVAGTNGKGSTCAIAASCLRQRYRTGLYTSPHLVRPNERIQLDGVEIDDDTFGRRISEVVDVLGLAHDLTYFEFGTVVAFWHFARERVDVAVLETGLGGRLDATTACAPEVTTITSIDFDHMEYLGHTLAAIAGEKAGIIKAGAPVISSRQAPEALQVLEAKARAQGSVLRLEGRDFSVTRAGDGTLTYAAHFGPSSTPLGQNGVTDDSVLPERSRGALPSGLTGLQLGLRGPHQQENLAVALASLEAMTRFPLTPEQVREGVRTARWPGRLEAFGNVLLDGAHNPSGVHALLAALDAEFPGRPVHLVFGVFADKDSEPMMRALFPRAAALHLAPVGSPRSRDPRSYEALARGLCPRVQVHPDAVTALSVARSEAPPDGLVVVAGSLFLVGQLRQGLVDEAR